MTNGSMFFFVQTFFVDITVILPTYYRNFADLLP